MIFYRHMNSGAAIITTPFAIFSGVKKIHFDLVLLEAGPSKIELMKTIRQTFGLPLNEPKSIIDNIPVILKECLSKEEAYELKNIFEKTGSKLEIK